MNVDVYWVDEDLIQRQIPKLVLTGFPHPIMALPVRRNALPDGHAFVVRCTSGESRTPVGYPPRPPIFPFESRVEWISTKIHAENIAMFHNLFPVPTAALPRPHGHASLDKNQRAAIDHFLAGMIWDESAGRALLPRTAAGKLVPREVRDAKPGTVLEIDGSPGVVVSNVAFNRRHVLGSLAVVPLVDGQKAIGTDRVAVGAFVAAPEFLKICQPFAGIHDVRLTGHQLDKESLGHLTTQLRELLAWGVEAPVLLSKGEAGTLALKETEHACLFSTRTRPPDGKPTKHFLVRRSRPIAGASEVFEPTLLDSTRYEGSQGTLRVELWDRRGVINLQFVAEGGTLEVINQISVFSQNGTVAVARGPVWPEDWTYSLAVGPLSEVQDQTIEVSIRAPGISAEYAFQLDKDGSTKETTSA
jgi:hypothetical protein